MLIREIKFPIFVLKKIFTLIEEIFEEFNFADERVKMGEFRVI